MGRTEVEVQALEVEVPRGHHIADGLIGLAGLDGEAELAVEHAGGREPVGVGVDGGRYADEDGLDASGGPGRVIENLELVEAVDDEVSDAQINGLAYLLGRLVVAMEVDGR